MLLFILIPIAVIITAAVVFGIIWLVRSHKFTPTKNKILQMEKINADLEPTGFAYSLKGDYFYSLMNCWQRETGYCKLYDDNAALFNMAFDCEPIPFSYAGKRWLIELWKGQYGITTGAEIGIYNTSRKDIHTSKFTGTFYENISDSERLPMSMVLRKNGSVLLKRKALHWWLTGFRLGEFSNVKSLTMDAKIKFPNTEMRNAFVLGLHKVGYVKGEYSVFRNTVKIHFTKPHNPQPESQQGAQIALVQQTNKNNCQLFAAATAPYTDSLDQLEYIKSMMPWLYHFFLNSLYSKGFYDAFNWLLDLIFGHHPHPEPPHPPCPPCPPCPPRPCDGCIPCTPIIRCAPLPKNVDMTAFFEGNDSTNNSTNNTGNSNDNDDRSNGCCNRGC